MNSCMSLFVLFVPVLIRQVHIVLYSIVFIVLYCIVLHAQLNKYHIVYIIAYLHKVSTLETLKRK
jgi:hypothetical protein